MSRLFSCGGLLLGGSAAGAVLALLLLMGSSPGSAGAEDLPGLTDPRSPLVFPPLFRAEMSASSIWVTLTSGKLASDSTAHSWDLERVFQMPRTNIFWDFMARLQAGRFSLRGYYEPRYLTGERRFHDAQIDERVEARFSYPGVRLGGDVDLARCNLSRVGVNVDYDLLAPSFSESTDVDEVFKITGKQPLTCGVHGMYNAGAIYYGISPIFEFRARWPIWGAEVTEVSIAAGAKAPETVLGSLALKSGYRHTVVEFSARHRTLNLTFDGWFSELTYYY